VTWDSVPADASGKFRNLEATLDERKRIQRASTTKDLIIMAKIASPHLAAAVNANVELARASLAALKTLKDAPNITLTAELNLDLCVERIQAALDNPPPIPGVEIVEAAYAESYRKELEEAMNAWLAEKPQTQDGRGYHWYTRDDFARIERELHALFVEPLVKASKIRGATFGIGYDRQHHLTVGTISVQP
jgi:hypothetical protein